MFKFYCLLCKRAETLAVVQTIGDRVNQTIHAAG